MVWLTILGFKNIFWQLVYYKVAYKRVVGSFNDAVVRRELDLKYPSIMKKPNPIDAVFKDKAKFEVKDPIIGSLVAQDQENETNEKAILNQLSGVLSTKDIKLAERLAKLRGEKSINNNDNNNNFPTFLSPLAPPPSPPGDGNEESDDNDDDDDLRNLTPT